MRWFVLALLGLNAILWFAGDLWIPSPISDRSEVSSLPRVADLKVGPQGAAPLDVSPAVQAASVDAAPEPVPDHMFCVEIGWFDADESARAAYADLGRPGAEFLIIERERALEPLHWVIVPPQQREQAIGLFRDLQRRSIDSYLVTSGENENAISLGLFQSEDAAERVLERKKNQNLNAVLAKFPRNQLSYALVFEVSQASGFELGGKRAKEYQDNFDMVEISRCEGIATNPETP